MSLLVRVLCVVFAWIGLIGGFASRTEPGGTPFASGFFFGMLFVSVLVFALLWYDTRGWKVWMEPESMYGQGRMRVGVKRYDKTILVREVDMAATDYDTKLYAAREEARHRKIALNIAEGRKA